MLQESAPLKNYAALRYFHEVADAGSYRLASERLHVAASAIHRQVTNLEDELGTQLFERGRGRNRLRLTAAGEIFAHHYKRAMGEIALARTGVDALSGLYRGAVNFGINEGCSRELLPQLLSEFHATHPAVSFEITVASSLRLVELTRNDEIDFAVGYNPPARAGVTALARREIGSSVMMNRQHPLAARASLRLSDCEPYDMVMPDASLAMRQTLDEMFASVGMRPRASLTTNSYDLLRQAACAGVGIAVLTQDLWGRESSPPDAVFIPLEDSRIAPQVIVCWTRAQRQLSVASLALIDAVKALLEKSAF
jgi:DNA-binding transcriptional LysR family regulator